MSKTCQYRIVEQYTMYKDRPKSIYIKILNSVYVECESVPGTNQY